MSKCKTTVLQVRTVFGQVWSISDTEATSVSQPFLTSCGAATEGPERPLSESEHTWHGKSEDSLSRTLYFEQFSIHSFRYKYGNKQAKILERNLDCGHLGGCCLLLKLWTGEALGEPHSDTPSPAMLTLGPGWSAGMPENWGRYFSFTFGH